MMWMRVIITWEKFISSQVLRKCCFRVGNWFKPPHLNHGLNWLKLNAFMPLAGINSVLPSLNQLKLPAGINQFKPLAGTNPI